MSNLLRLENGVGSKSRRNEQVARSEAECQSGCYVHDGCLSKRMIVTNGGERSSTPSFLVNNMDNVNAGMEKARDLITMWDFLEYKGRVGRSHVILNKKEEPSTLKVMPTKCRSRYFDDGRFYISIKIMKRLGKYNRVTGLMETLTYAPKETSKQDAWTSFGKDTRRFLNAVNEYRKRRDWRRLHYLWVVEVQPDTGYPHVHIFFPNLKWIAPLSIINGNWRHGRANIESPKKIKVNCAAYISKYLRKMRGWSDLRLALLWSGKCRMYGFSRGFSARVEKMESEWQRWHIVVTDHPEQLEKGLEEGGYIVEHNEVKGGEHGTAVGKQ